MAAAEPALAASSAQTPPPDAGDHLTRDEFERHYEARLGVKKAELVEGVVFMPWPVSLKDPAEPHGRARVWLSGHVLETPGVRIGDNATVRLDWDNDPQPDSLLFIDPELGGQAELDKAGYLRAAPELVVEIAASSASDDLHSKVCRPARVPADRRTRQELAGCGE